MSKSTEFSIFQPFFNFSFYYLMNIHRDNRNNTENIINVISTHNPIIIRGIASSLEVLADHFLSSSSSNRPRPRMILSGAEELLPNVRNKIQHAFQAKVLCIYGLSEIGGIVAEECKEVAGYHINTMDYYIEVVDEKLQQVPNGVEGEIVITNFYCKTIPIYRYMTGDYGVITNDKCKCGRVSPRILTLNGLKLTRFSLPDGSTFNPYTAFKQFLNCLPFTKFQMIQKEGRILCLFYTSNQDLEGNELMIDFSNYIKRLYGGEIDFVSKRINSFEIKKKFPCFVNLYQNKFYKI